MADFNCTVCDDLGSCEDICDDVADRLLGIIHIMMAIVGFLVNILALYLFYKMGKQKPYYIVIVFETFTDLVVCATAFYSGMFLISGRDTGYGDLAPLCELGGIVWNWNMVITPLLLSVAGLMRLHAVYRPHSALLEQNRNLVTGLCVVSYIYALAYSCFPLYSHQYEYVFKNEWSVCDFNSSSQDADSEVQMVLMFLLGPVTMLLSLLLIIVTNVVIVTYLMRRYKTSWAVSKEKEKVKNSRKQGSFGSFMVNMDQKVQSKQVVLSLLMMTVWYLLCYSIIIFCNVRYVVMAATKRSYDHNFGMARRTETYFYLVYNFLAYLNSFVNPFILLSTGSSFRQELGRLSLRIRSKCGVVRASVVNTSDTSCHTHAAAGPKRSYQPLPHIKEKEKRSVSLAT